MLSKLEKLKDYLNGSESERFLNYYAGKHFTGSITLTDGETGTLYFEKGHVTKVQEGIPETGIDLGFKCPAKLWDKFSTLHRSSNRIKSFFGTDPEFKDIGEAVRARQFNGTVAQVCRLYSYIREGKALWSDLPEREPDVYYNVDHVRGYYLKVNGIKIYVETNDGPDDAATIICLHTAGRDNRQYHDMMEIFAGKYRMYAPDMPSHGKSWPLPGNEMIRDYKTYGKWIQDITDALGVKNPIFIGCSMSGGITYHMAQEYNPRAIVCMQGCDNTEQKGPAMDAYLELFTHPGNNPAVTQKEFSDSLLGNHTSVSRRDYIRWGVECEVGFIKKGDFEETMGLNISDKMYKVTCPTMIIEGTEDLTYTVAMAQGSYDRLVNCKNKRLELLEGYGHFVIVEAPEKVCELLDDFIHSL